MSADVYIINVNQTQPVVMQFEQMQPVQGGLATLYPFKFTATEDGQTTYDFLNDATVSPVLTTAPYRVCLVAVAGVTQDTFTYANGVLTITNDAAERVLAGDPVSGLYGEFVPGGSTGKVDHDQLAHLDYAHAGHTGFSPTTHSHQFSDSQLNYGPGPHTVTGNVVIVIANGVPQRRVVDYGVTGNTYTLYGAGSEVESYAVVL